MNEPKFFVYRNVFGKHPKAPSSEGGWGRDGFILSCAPGSPRGQADDKHKCEAFCMKMLTQSTAWKEVSGTTPRWGH